MRILCKTDVGKVFLTRTSGFWKNVRFDENDSNRHTLTIITTTTTTTVTTTVRLPTGADERPETERRGEPGTSARAGGTASVGHER